MIINFSQFSELYKKIMDIQDEVTVLYPSIGISSLDDLHFALGEFDLALFWHENPYTSDNYKGLGIRELKKTLFAIKQGRIDYRNFKKGDYGFSSLDIGGLCQQRKLLYKLNKLLSNYDWKTSSFTSPGEELANVAKRDTIILAASDLARTPGGKALAVKLWETYSPHIYNPIFYYQTDHSSSLRPKLPIDLNKRERTNLVKIRVLHSTFQKTNKRKGKNKGF